MHFVSLSKTKDSGNRSVKRAIGMTISKVLVASLINAN